MSATPRLRDTGQASNGEAPDPPFGWARVRGPESPERRLERLREWASSLTAEDDPPSDYLCPDSVKRLVERLKASPKSLDFVLASQGTGKSAAACHIESLALGDADPPEAGKEPDPRLIPRSILRWKWKEPGDLYPQLTHCIEDAWPPTRTRLDLTDRFYSFLSDELYALAMNDPAYNRKLREKVLETRAVDASRERYKDVTVLNAMAGAKVNMSSWQVVGVAWDLAPCAKRERVKKATLLKLFERSDAPQIIVVDMPDYRRKDARLINSDLSELSGFWQELVSLRWAGHFVVFIQKELYGGHFFEGKGFRFEMAPFQAPELVRYYQGLFGGSQPFTDEALSLVAQMSRGVFRRMKRYTLLCLEAWEATESQNREDVIGAKLVRRAVTEDELSKDLELELSKLFPREESARLAARLVSVVAKSSEPVNQKSLAVALGVGPDVVGRLVEALDSNGYVMRENMAAGKVVRLS